MEEEERCEWPSRKNLVSGRSEANQGDDFPGHRLFIP